MRLYYHRTDGGAEYLSSENVPGTDEGAFETPEGKPARYLLRIDLESDVSVLAVASDLLEALKDIKANLTGRDCFAERVADSVRRAEAAIAKAETPPTRPPSECELCRLERAADQAVAGYPRRSPFNPAGFVVETDQPRLAGRPDR